MSIFDDMVSDGGGDAEVTRAGVTRVIEVIHGEAPNALIIQSGITIHPGMGPIPATRGTNLEISIGQHNVALFVYPNTYQDARHEFQLAEPQTRSTIAADVIKFSGPSIDLILPERTGLERFNKMFAESVVECNASFLVGSFVRGQGVIDDKTIRPLAFRLDPHFKDFMTTLTDFNRAPPSRPLPDVRNLRNDPPPFE